jgi:hypothetical protein
MAKAKTEKSGSAEPHKPEQAARRNFPRILIVGLVCAALSLTIYWLRLNTIFGHPYVDDAYYLVLAKALAAGQGYTLVNSLSSGLQPLYPPGFAFILSVFWRITPTFPNNIVWFKWLQVFAVFGVGGLSYLYYVRHHRWSLWLALAAVLTTVLSPSLVFFATTTLMSECVFMLLQMLALVAVAECVRQAKAGEARLALLFAVPAGLFAAFAFLTRSIGVALMVAVLAWLLKERLIKPLLTAAAMMLLIVLPWQLYARSHAASEEIKREQQGYIVMNYTQVFWQRSAGEDETNVITLGELPERVRNNFGTIVGQQFGLLYISRLLPSLGEVGFGFLSFLLSALAMIGLVSRCRQDLTASEIYVVLSLGFILLWPWDPMRFLLPLMPLLILYVICGGQALWAWWRRKDASPNWRWAVGLAGFMTLLNLVSNFEFIGSLDAQGRRNAGEMGQFAEIESMMGWIKENIAENEVCASLNPGLVYLYTNRKTVSAQDPIGNWEVWKTWGVRYLILTKPYGVPERDTAGKPIRVAWQSKRAPMLRIVDLGTPGERAPWPAKM